MSRVPGFLLAALAATVALAGCSGGGGGGSSDGGTPTQPPLAAGKGAIAGLLLDDALRPIPEGLLLLQPVGLTATSDRTGEFGFTDLDPGTYVIRAQAEGHEAAPLTIDVAAGEYAEAQISARRVFNQAGRIITNEYSVFIPCAAGFVVNGVTANCLLDLSGDSYRSSFTSNLTAMANITYMVTEWKFNQVGDWNGQIREDNGEPAGGERYAVLDIVQADYGKVLLQPGVLNTEANGQNNNVPWNNTKEFATAIFLNGQFKGEAQSAADAVCQPSVDQTCLTMTGAGAAFGIRARIVQSVFIDEPAVDVNTYCVLC